MSFFRDTQEEKDNTIHFRFPRIEQKDKEKTISLPLMHDIIPSIGKFKYATTINLIMDHYSILLDEKSRERCVIFLPWGLDCYNVLPRRLIVSTDIFQEVIGKLMADLEKVFVYMDDIIIIGERCKRSIRNISRQRTTNKPR